VAIFWDIASDGPFPLEDWSRDAQAIGRSRSTDRRRHEQPRFGEQRLEVSRAEGAQRAALPVQGAIGGR
jgi:hypothetical protein